MSTFDFDSLGERIIQQSTEFLSGFHESSIIVGISVNGERRVFSALTPGAEMAPMPKSDSIYEIGSVSKTFSNTVLAVLEDQGKLSIDDPISKHLPASINLRPEVAAITLKQLATHSSGLISTGVIHTGYINEEMRGWEPPFGTYTHYLRYTKADLYSDLETVEFAHPTGTGFLYSVIGMGTLGHICELVGGKPYEELLRELVLDPLGLSDTYYTAQQEHMGRRYFAYDAEGQPLPNWYHDVLMSQGGLRSTVDDMLIYCEANIAAQNDGADTELARAMRRTKHVYFQCDYEPGPMEFIDGHWNGQVNHGLAWRGFKDQPSAWWHPGTTLFYQTDCAIDTDKRVGMILLSTNRKTLMQINPINAMFHDWFRSATA